MTECSNPQSALPTTPFSEREPERERLQAQDETECERASDRRHRMPTVPEGAEIPLLLGELVSVVAEANRNNGGLYSFGYYRGKWIELERWNGERQEIMLPKDTEITEDGLKQAIDAVRDRERLV